MSETPPSRSGPSKKRHRVNTHAHRSPPSTAAVIIDSSFPPKPPPPPQPSSTSSSISSPLHQTATPNGFNDSSTADVILRLIPDPVDHETFVYLHASTILRAKYFSAALSDRWQNSNINNNNFNDDTDTKITVELDKIVSLSNIPIYLTVLELLYTLDFRNVITKPAIALSILPVALELLFEDCVNFCVKFLEAVPWTEDDEKRILSLIPLISEEESKELLARVFPVKNNALEEMLDGLIISVIHNYPNVAYVKAFVARLLRDFASEGGTVRRVLERAFEASLKVVRESLEEYSSPDFRGGDHNETEAIQRLNLHTAMTNGRHLLWLVERMIELRVADGAVKVWSEQGGFTADLQRAIREDAWRNIVPGFPNVVLRCTSKIANAVAAGTILAARQVRMKLVKNWLPVLIVCKDNMSSMMPSHKSLYQELEETFLRIISTLPMSDSQELLKQCLSFSTRNVEDCPYLITAFNTWFRRATGTPLSDNR